MNKFKLHTVFLAIFFSTFCLALEAQSPNEFGLLVQQKARDYHRYVNGNPAAEMVDIAKEIPAIRLDLRYTTPENFTGKKLYRRAATTFGRRKLANILIEAETDLRQQGYGILVWDAYRPYRATKKMWKIVPDSRYAANPKTGSMHNRGAAIDLTLYDLQTGRELDMGTGFDHFTDTAHIDFKGLPEVVLSNRKLLADVLTAKGLVQLKTEWWHFYLPDARDYPLMNFSFKKMQDLVSP